MLCNACAGYGGEGDVKGESFSGCFSVCTHQYARAFYFVLGVFQLYFISPVAACLMFVLIERCVGCGV